MTLTQADIKKILDKYDMPNQQDIGSYIERLKRMRDFYAEKAPHTASKMQGLMFEDFIVALDYSITSISQYSELVNILTQYGDIK